LKITRWYRWTAIAAAIAVLIVALRTCGIGQKIAAPEPVEQIEPELTLQTVTLEQPDENGSLLWRLKAKSVNYSPNNQRAKLKELEGEFFQAGETIYTVVADEGEVRQNGETLYLTGNLVAKGAENELTLESDRLKWQPKQDRLIMGDFEDDALSTSGSENSDVDDTDAGDGNRADGALAVETRPLVNPSSDEPTANRFPTENSDKPAVKGFSPQIETTAQVVTVINQEDRVDLSGGVIAKSKETPWLTFESDSLVWFTELEQVEAQQLLKVEQYASKDYRVVSDRILGAKGEVNLTDSIVTLDESVQLTSLSQSSAQPLKAESKSAVWDVENQTVALDNPVKLEQPEQKITASANQARLDLGQEVIYLTGNVQANGEEKGSQLNADSLTWRTGSQDVEAEGNVSYQQAVDPEVSMTGERAVGNIEQGTVVVTDSRSGEVVIEIVPNGF